ncbi:MAG: OHCU decarboxylase [Paracoccaceae bacterium]|jgi:OHCU decarboxylase
MERYPRDMSGYGRIPPKANWPGGARIAIQIVVNYEEGGENNILHGDDASEAFLSEIVGAQPWPNQRHSNMESIYEYGSRAGFWRLHRLFTYMNIPITVFGVATALARSPEQVAAMKEANWEIASHGLKWIEYRDFYPEDERKHMIEAMQIHTEIVGERPLGWYTGRSSENTVRLVAEEGGFTYCADSYSDDLPYWERTGAGNLLIVPYTLDANDMRFATPQGFNTGEHFFQYLKDTFDVLYAEGAAGRPKMMSVGLHCRLAGRPGRVMAVKRFLDYVNEHSDVWFARRIDIARHWTRAHPPTAQRVRPSRMDKASFAERFGRVFEHSHWVAERAHALEMGPAHDTAQGIHALLVQIFRRASKEERMNVLIAHPDLAGKLAAARKLTGDSTDEQASAGLDALTEEERRTFTDLNDRYVAKFGFPFIIAVRDHSKASILQAFQQRLENQKEQEFSEACRQVERIAELRLHAMEI